MFKKLLYTLVFIYCICLHPLTSFANQLLNDLSEAELIALAAGSCKATYSDRAATSLFNLSKYYSLDLEPFVIESKILNTNFIFAQRLNQAQNTNFYILAFRGSETKQDWILNFKTAKIPYQDNLLAPSNSALENFPLIHKGFNEYTNLALAVTDQNGRKLTDLLLADINAPILITGHSLGGAVATLYACRLLDLGISPDRIKVITFGAPEIGNAAYATLFQNRLPLLRITTSQDLIPVSLNKFVGGYKNFGNHLEYKTKLSKYSYADQHKMSFYFSESIKRYYDLHQLALSNKLLVAPANQQVDPDFDLVAVYNDYTPALKKLSDYRYLNLLLDNQLRMFIPSYDLLNDKITLNSNNIYNLIPEITASAKASQAKYLLINQLDTTLNSETERRSLIFSYVLVDLDNNRVLTTATYSSSLACENSSLQTLIQISQSLPAVLKQYTLK